MRLLNSELGMRNAELGIGIFSIWDLGFWILDCLDFGLGIADLGYI